MFMILSYSLNLIILVAVLNYNLYMARLFMVYVPFFLLK